MSITSLKKKMKQGEQRGNNKDIESEGEVGVWGREEEEEEGSGG